MKTSFKKLVAGASLVALVAMNVALTNAAAVTITWFTRDSATAYTVTSAAWFNAWAGAVCTVVVTDSENPATTETFTWADCTVTDVNTLTLANSAVDFNNSYVTVTFSNSDDTLATAYWAGAFVVWTVANGTQNKVNVSAVVLPILTMSLNSTALELWVLPTAVNTYATQSVWVTTATNAQWGLVVAMASEWLKDTAINREIWVTDIAANAQTAATDYYKVSTNAAASIVDANGADLTTTAGTDMLATQNVVSWGAFAAPHNATTTTVTIWARADTTTEAWNYSDVLTFTVTGTF